ncbi:MAG: methyl-accepting chemotaxis protein [Endomicrobiales bacterium]|nr:methyl-accepting chemotaxis protein [Endomicrobiales bacterium]
MRKTYFVKPGIQIKYLLIVLFVVCLTAAAVYFTFWSTLIKSPGMDQLSAGEFMALQRAYQVNFIWVVLIILFGVGLESVFLFHRIIGPIFVFERTIKSLAEGDFTAGVSLRKKDELKDLADSLQEFIDNVKSNVENDRKQIQEIKSQVGGDLHNKLAALTSWFRF